MRNVVAIFGILAMSLTAMADDQTKTQAAGWIVKATSVNEAMAEFTASPVLSGVGHLEVKLVSIYRQNKKASIPSGEHPQKDLMLV